MLSRVTILARMLTNQSFKIASSIKGAAKAVTITTGALLICLTTTSANAESRIKDLVSFEGVRENQLVGYGLVVGLNGTGDTLRNSPFTEQSIIAMLERMGVNTRGTNMKSVNTAAVMVTANLSAFSRVGSRVDVSISSIGDAQDLRGGTLVVTPLFGADGNVYAVAQGSLQISGFTAGGAAETVTQGVPTAGRIPNGALIERELNYSLNDNSSLNLSLRSPDFTTARRISYAINQHIGSPVASPLDPATVEITVPDSYSGNMFSFITDIEQLNVDPDQRAKVVVDERSGIIVIGSEVKVSEVAIAQGNLTIRVTETPQVSQPGAFAEGGETQVVPRTEVEVDESEIGRKFAILESGVNLQDLVDGLNALGINPRDMIAILQALKVSGALHADIEVM
ncbi:flagellar basal body P-ring protein FlgI [Pseudemcibacter aquimaris]|uniref:flagellar basal body P-ring protein FlgI n=1 Tax=Pseudemcibacter aquimaris TaxID=2857064 RepID=UPI002013AE50|nr:flagellar basal body P-ring protein FlgI [Pseudemcibacter aquimaris]MCC3860807.1 flagellar basal body P-ring protein FlgI [Pseudemcibacter aquimaris]WDU59627.1 flagellar basal body P-ring protein FlgI [Pseudemcibacter aquimaris]